MVGFAFGFFFIWDGFDGSPTSDASLSCRSLFSYGFSSFFFFFLGCDLIGGLGNGWVWMGSGGGVLWAVVVVLC